MSQHTGAFTIVNNYGRMRGALLVSCGRRRLVASERSVDSMPYVCRWFWSPFPIVGVEWKGRLNKARVGDCHN